MNTSVSDNHLTIRPLEKGDKDELISFAQDLPPSDLLFVERDLRHPLVVEAWMNAIEAGEIHSQLAIVDDRIAGYSALVVDPLSWSPHVGEIRVAVSSQYRRGSIGRKLAMAAREKGADLGLAKLTAKMTVDQHGAIALFEELGFRAEALLRDHVKAPDGALYDLAILSHDVAASSAQRQLLGISEG